MSISLPAKKVQTMNGMGRFLDPHTVEITLNDGDIRVVAGDKIMIAVGTRPYRPADVPFNSINVLDSDEIVDIPRLPRSLTVVGGGVIGVEYATIFSALDVNVALIEARPSLLEFIDHELVEDFTHQLRDRGMAIRFGAKVARIEFENDWPVTILDNGRRVRSEMVLYAAGLVTGATDTLNPGILWLDHRMSAACWKVDPATFQHRRCHTSTHGWGRHRISEPGVNVDGAGTYSGLPRIRHHHAAGPGLLPVWDLRGAAGNLHRWHERGRSAPPRHPLRVRNSPVSAKPHAAISWD